MGKHKEEREAVNVIRGENRRERKEKNSMYKTHLPLFLTENP